MKTDSQVDSMKPEHGGDLFRFGKRYGKKRSEIIDFSSNVNPLGIPESLVNVYLDCIQDLSSYPDPDSRFLCGKLAGFFSCSSENVIAGNGSTGVLSAAIRALRPGRALLVEPCFGEYRRLLQLDSVEIENVILSREDDFKFPLEKILSRLNGLDLLILGHPNNPTGTALSLQEMDCLLQEAKRKEVFVIVDEAFVDWAPAISVVPRLAGSSSLLIVRSLTKFFSLAGIRSGFALGPPKLIEEMKEYQGPWACNVLAQRLSAAILEDSSFQEKSRLWFQEERIWLSEALQPLRVFKVFPSLTNFFLIRSTKSLTGFFDFLGTKGIYVRSVLDFFSLDGSYFRIAIRIRKENQFLIAALSDWAAA